jgi:hypothetical protein
MKYLVKQPEKFRKKSEVPHFISPKTKSAKINSCEIEDHKENPIVMIARIFNMFPVPMIEDKRKFICKVREIVFKYQYYDMNEFFSCKFKLGSSQLTSAERSQAYFF